MDNNSCSLDTCIDWRETPLGVLGQIRNPRQEQEFDAAFESIDGEKD